MGRTQLHALGLFFAAAILGTAASAQTAEQRYTVLNPSLDFLMSWTPYSMNSIATKMPCSELPRLDRALAKSSSGEFIGRWTLLMLISMRI